MTYANFDTLHANQLLMIGILKQLQIKETTIMSALTDLQAAQAALATAVQSAITDITNLAAALASASGSNDDAGAGPEESGKAVTALIEQVKGLFG